MGRGTFLSKRSRKVKEEKKRGCDGGTGRRGERWGCTLDIK